MAARITWTLSGYSNDKVLLNHHLLRSDDRRARDLELDGVA